MAATIRVATWNLWWRFGDWEKRLDTISSELNRHQPDICGFQEVWADERSNQAAVLADRLGYHLGWIASTVPEHWRARSGDPNTETGYAVVSRWPIMRLDHADLDAPGEDAEGRSVVFASIAAPFGSVPFFTTHLSAAWARSDLRQQQLSRLVDFVRKRSGSGYPPIVTGDFNASPDTDEIRRLTGSAPTYEPGYALLDTWVYVRPLDPGWTWVRTNPLAGAHYLPNGRIDYIFVGSPTPDRGGEAVSATLLGREPINGVWCSDHLGVMVNLHTGDGAQQLTR